MPAMWTIPDVSATEEKKLFSFFPRILRGCLTGTHQLSWGNNKKTTLGIFNNRMLARMGISLSEIGTGVPFFQGAQQIFTPLHMACKYTRIFCPVLYILGR
jgi:hypothetical protein